jgi:hypothetical protein
VELNCLDALVHSLAAETELIVGQFISTTSEAYLLLLGKVLVDLVSNCGFLQAF